MKRIEWVSLSQRSRVEYEDRKSVFIAYAAQVRSNGEAISFLNEI